MPRNNGSNDDASAFREAMEEVMYESKLAADLGAAARAASDDPDTVAKAETTLAKGLESKSEKRLFAAVDAALEIDPGCTDALSITAQTFDEPTDAGLLLEAAIEVAERRLGAELLETGRGSFYEIEGTRPYIRALFALAESDFEAMDYDASFESFHRILDLAGNDEMGARYQLIGMLLAADRLEAARKLAFERYAGEESAYMLWARALALYMERDFDAGTAMVERAKEANPFVLDLLTGEEDMPDERPAGPHASGSLEEAAEIAAAQAAGWRMRPLALIWAEVGGGAPGDEQYFGAYTDVDLQSLFDESDDDDFEDDSEDDDDPGDTGPYLLN